MKYNILNKNESIKKNESIELEIIFEAEDIPEEAIFTVKRFLDVYPKYNTRNTRIRKTNKGNYFLYPANNPGYCLLSVDKYGYGLGGIGYAFQKGKMNLAGFSGEVVKQIVNELKNRDENVFFAKDVESVDVSYEDYVIRFHFNMMPNTTYKVGNVAVSLKKEQINSFANGIIQNFEKAKIDISPEEIERIEKIAYDSLVREIEKTKLTKKQSEIIKEYHDIINKLLSKSYSAYYDFVMGKLNIDNVKYNKTHHGIEVSLSNQVYAQINLGEKKASVCGINGQKLKRLKESLPCVPMYTEVSKLLKKRKNTSISFHKEGETCGILVSEKGTKVFLPSGKPWKRNINQYIKKLEKKEKEERDKNKKKIEDMPLCGSYIAVAIVDTVIKNDNYITPGIVCKFLRGLSIDFRVHIRDSEYKDKFSIVSSEEVKKYIDELCESGVIKTRKVKGTYGDFYILKRSDISENFIYLSKNKTNRKTDKKTDYELIEIMRNDNPGEQKTETMMNHLNLFLEHPGIICMDENAVEEYSNKLPKEAKAYLKAMYSVEDVAWKKKMIKRYI